MCEIYHILIPTIHHKLADFAMGSQNQLGGVKISILNLKIPWGI